jgi:hypothetical protein
MARAAAAKTCRRLSQVLGLVHLHQPQVGFMHERRGLQSLSWPFLSQLLGRQPAQLVVNQRQQLLGSVWVALLNGGHDAGSPCSQLLSIATGCSESLAFPGVVVICSPPPGPGVDHQANLG